MLYINTAIENTKQYKNRIETNTHKRVQKNYI